ncbi:TIGR03862 family flavoprotein [Chitinimonas sp. JJ19]|uniref:TIGR03862 family flavoprotein n=1 Tax=Chitinimonas sp. JJ19 TaxID=3109352 RepID=UPI00300163E0
MSDTAIASSPAIAIIGGGPAGLMAAEVLAQAGLAVDVYDAMPSVGRKFLLAGVGGMNITHSEPLAPFLSRYGEREHEVGQLLADFGPDALCDWIHGLGIATFVGSSGRVFPTDMKAAPLLRAWLHRLKGMGVRIHVRHRWLGWTADGSLRLATADGEKHCKASATVLALGGASWPRLGSDGAWQPLLAAQGVGIAPLRPANCGFEVAWSQHFREKFAGAPLKSVVLSFADGSGKEYRKQGEFVISDAGVEGSLIYAHAAALREQVARQGHATIHIDLAPGRDLARVQAEVAHPRGSRSLSSHLQSKLGITGVKAGLLRECLSKEAYNDMALLAQGIKALPITLGEPRPLAEAISTAGGVRFEALDRGLMLRQLPGVFCAGEMLDWEAPTGGYLLSACFASGRKAGQGVLDWLGRAG